MLSPKRFTLRAFSVLELLTLVAVFSILATILIPTVTTRQEALETPEPSPPIVATVPPSGEMFQRYQAYQMYRTHPQWKSGMPWKSGMKRWHRGNSGLTTERLKNAPSKRG